MRAHHDEEEGEPGHKRQSQQMMGCWDCCLRPTCHDSGVWTSPCCLLSIPLGIVGFIFFMLWVTGFESINDREQLLISDRQQSWTVDGPVERHHVKWWQSSEVREPKLLLQDEYAITKDTKSGGMAVRHGPGRLFLGAYEEEQKVEKARTLGRRDYMIVENKRTGQRKVISGMDGSGNEGFQYRPCVSPARVGDAPITDNICAQEDLGELQSAVVLSKHQFVKVTNKLDGSIKVVRGIDGPEKDGLTYFPCASINKNEEVSTTCAFEDLDDVQDARVVTAESALLVKSTTTGTLRLVDTPGPYFPGAYEEVMREPRHLIRVAQYETVVVEKEDGTYEFHAGSSNSSAHSGSTSTSVTKSSGTSFFLPPYAKVLSFKWTSGYDVEDQTEKGSAATTTITKIDQRMQQLFFEYDDVRTNDNIEFEVEGTIFWQVEDVQKMVTATNDPTGDLWHRMRSRISEAASSYNYREFLVSLRNLTAAVKQNELTQEFYSMRGVKVYDIQLIEVELRDEKLEEKIVGAMAVEAIDRMNRVNSQKSETEVEIVKLNGAHAVDAAKVANTRALESLRAENALMAEQNTQALKVKQQENQLVLEKHRTAYLDVVRNNSMLQARSTGEQRGVMLGSVVEKYLDSMQRAGLSVNQSLSLYKLRMMYENQNTTTSNLAKGDAQLYLTPAQANVHLGDALQVNLPADAP